MQRELPTSTYPPLSEDSPVDFESSLSHKLNSNIVPIPKKRMRLKETSYVAKTKPLLVVPKNDSSVDSALACTKVHANKSSCVSTIPKEDIGTTQSNQIFLEAIAGKRLIAGTKDKEAILSNYQESLGNTSTSAIYFKQKGKTTTCPTPTPTFCQDVPLQES